MTITHINDILHAVISPLRYADFRCFFAIYAVTSRCHAIIVVYAYTPLPAADIFAIIAIRCRFRFSLFRCCLLLPCHVDITD